MKYKTTTIYVRIMQTIYNLTDLLNMKPRLSTLIN